ncbi:MAG: hypothetical protein F4081_04285 [Dehalococcoidia bacterium]|nr:hypothetical protein [Dehalococcoidia bacterium]MYI86007.1 hypothetical protein [Dehalococcoidia bacterium]
MPRRLPREVHIFPEDFPQGLERLKEASGLTWTELARRLGTNSLTLRRWRSGVRPNALHLLALQDLAASLDLAHLLPVVRGCHAGQ